MTSQIFSQEKDSIRTNAFFAPEFAAFYITHKGEEGNQEIEGPLDEVEEGSRRILTSKVSIIKDTKVKMPIYEPLAAILSRICLDLAPDDVKEVLIFIENSRSNLQVMPDTNTEKPDLVGFFVPRETSRRIVLGILTRKDPDWPVVPPTQGVVSVVECKVSANPDRQCLRYLFLLSRHKPETSVQYGLVANKRTFRLIGLGLDRQLMWEKVAWDNPQSIEKLYKLVRCIVDEATRGRPSAVPKLRDVFEVKKRTIGTYSVTLSGQKYRLLQLFSGRGNGQKPFIAIAASENKKSDARIFKYSWHKEKRYNRERSILEKLIGVPGVVQIDRALSIDSIEIDEESKRRRNLLVLKTIGYPLCSCSTVQDFLEAMYDLLEVLRYLVQEKNILHRDVSWGNVLVIPQGEEIPTARKASRDTESERKEKTCDAQQASSRVEPAKYSERLHEYRFVYELLGEDKARIRVALADFDHAADLEDPADDLRQPTGTPMFMAHDVIEPRNLNYSRGLAEPKARAIQKAVATGSDRYADKKERDIWDEFFASERLERPQWKLLTSDKEMTDSFRHGAMHDAESVFWILLLFFYRMVPAGKDVPPEELESMKEKRGKAFKHLREKKLGDRSSCDFFAIGLPSLYTADDDEKLREIYASLDIINTYLLIPWYNVAGTGRRERYEFHLHEFMQGLLWKHIVRLRDSGDPIRVDRRPLAVKVDYQVTGDEATSCKQVLPTFDSEGNDGIGRLKVGELKNLDRLPLLMNMSQKRRKVEKHDFDMAITEEDESLTDSHKPALISVDDVALLVQMFEKYFLKYHWDILWWKRQERTWYAADELYK
ncbi:hypothetical protein ACEPAF_5914 [Sanghuangporus sanghuang]